MREKQKLREKAAGHVDSKVVEDDPLGRTGPRNYGTSIKGKAHLEDLDNMKIGGGNAKYVLLNHDVYSFPNCSA